METFTKSSVKSLTEIDDINKIYQIDKHGIQTCMPSDQLCTVSIDEIIKLKDSTRKLLYLVEEIQSKIHCRSSIPQFLFPKLDQDITNKVNDVKSVSDLINSKALKNLEKQTKILDAIYIEEEEDCSVYKRLTGKCHCLNQHQYNDFIIHFNENTKYYTTSIGEIIKNLHIVKKFLYIGGLYTKNALRFLNDGLANSSHTENVEIIQGCSYADICNIFEDHSIVTMCISWPCKYEHIGDTMTQNLAASFLLKLSKLEEGRRYLKLSSKISNDLKKVLRKQSGKLEFETIDTLNSVFSLLHPTEIEHLNITYYCKPNDEDVVETSNQVLNSLAHFRKYMTLEEVCNNLDLIVNLCSNELGKVELIAQLPAMLAILKNIMLEYDNSQINILVTNILNSIVSKNMVKEQAPMGRVVADVGTESIKMKNEYIQIPLKKNTKKGKINLQKNGPAYNKQVSHRKYNRSRKFCKDLRNSVIVVPIED